MRGRKNDVPLTDSRLTAAKKTAIKLKTRQKPTDPECSGLRVDAYPTGKVTFSAEYKMPGIATRMHVKLGEWPEMPIVEARKLTELVRDLGMRGVDVQWGLHTRLVQELKRDGLDWRPALAPPARRKG